MPVRSRSGLRPFLTASILACLMAISSVSQAIGILVPREAEYSPIQLGPAEVVVNIKNNLAKTRVVQEFFNPNPRQLEADFYFPVPKGANVTDFVLYMNGKPVRGEVLEKDKAREIYEGIVRRMKDPGLVEWMDYNLFKVRVFPVPANGTQKIELEFAQPLQADQGSFRYVFPIRAPHSVSERPGNIPQVKFTVDLASDDPIRNIYSPSHRVQTDQKDPGHAVVTLPAEALSPAAGDFVLFYEPSGKDVALSLVAQRSGSDDGFFALMLSPKLKVDEQQMTPNDVTFVIDSSGSMADGNKIEQARRALAYCVGQLNDRDSFDIVRFSTEVEKYKENLVPGTKESIANAKSWIEKIQPRGGTNISSALEEALKLKPSDDKSSGQAHIYTIVFITDGLPTIGTTNIDDILRSVREQNKGNIRVFTFGVGNDVNTKLLDRLADDTRAVADYIKPAEDMEVPISRFFDKISRPAMANLKLEIPGAEVYDLYPTPLPDLFYGSQLTVFGRYKKPGQSAIRLTGQVAGKSTEFTYEKTFPETETSNEFVEKLWATRKIGYLLDEVRRNGENSELKDEVVKLSKKYGIVTPYTSYLVAEDTEVRPALAAAPQPQTWGGPVPASQMRQRAMSDRMEGPVGAPMSASASAMEAGRAGGVAKDLSKLSINAPSGESAVRASKALRSMKDKKSVDQDGSDLRSAAGRSFRSENGAWIDTQIQPDEKPVLTIKYLSDAYFAAARANPALAQALALGDHVFIKLHGGILEIGPTGKEKLESADETLLQDK